MNCDRMKTVYFTYVIKLMHVIHNKFQVVGGGFGDWMELAEERDRWRSLVSAAMNFRFV